MLADLVMQCLAKDADARPQQAREIVQVLDSATSGGGHAAMPVTLLGGHGMLRNALLALRAVEASAPKANRRRGNKAIRRARAPE